MLKRILKLLREASEYPSLRDKFLTFYNVLLVSKKLRPLPLPGRDRVITVRLRKVEEPFYEASEAALCSLVIVLCFALRLTRFYYPLAFPIEAGLSLISFATPISGMLYLSATQVIPDPPGTPLPTAQMALLGFSSGNSREAKLGLCFPPGVRKQPEEVLAAV